MPRATASMSSPLLNNVQHLEDLPGLFERLGYRPDRCPIGDNAVIVARWRSYLVVAAKDHEPLRAVTRLCDAFARSNTHLLAIGIHEQERMVLGVRKLETSKGIRLLTVDLERPTSDVLSLLSRLAPGAARTALQHALRIDALFSSEAVSERFYSKFRSVHARMADQMPKDIPTRDKHMIALLALMRMLFLYFVQAKGWLAGQSDYLRNALDTSLAQEEHFHERFLNRLYFDTLNHPREARDGHPAFQDVPYLNGGLFERHPLERRWKHAVANNDVWRDAFDDLFERFRFCVKEAHQADAIAPDMLGRVFERIMAPDIRHNTGTFYTPEHIVRRIVDLTLATSLAHLGDLSPRNARKVIRGEPNHPVSPRVYSALHAMRVLDPAVGSGAFLLVTLESLTRAHLGVSGALHQPVDPLIVRRRVLENNLFGVDLNPIAVRLAELRLWLAIIADDPTTDIGRVQPLPNLDGFVRQGDSLFDPVGAAQSTREFVRLPTRISQNVVRARSRLFHARGKARKDAIASLRKAELQAAEHALTASISVLSHILRDLATEARGKDLFGKRTGMPEDRRVAYGRYRELRSANRKALAAVREGIVPFFSYDVHAPEIMAEGGFTAVVGNPPWVRAERLSAGDRERLKNRFSWWRGGPGAGFRHLPDLAVAFTERALEITRPGGVVGFLLPSKVATAAYAEHARHHLSHDASLICVHRLPDNVAAQFGATTYPLVLLAKKESPSATHTVKLNFTDAEGLAQRCLQRRGPWVLTSSDIYDALQTFLNAGTPLGQVSPAALGVKTGANDIFIGRLTRQTRQEVVLSFAHGEHAFAPNDVRPVVRGRDVSRFQLRPRRWIVWTHGTDGRPLAKLSHQAAAYLRVHTRRLERRVDYHGGPLWTLYRTSSIPHENRVVWSDIVREPAAVTLSETSSANAIPLNSCYVAHAPNRDTALVLTAVMNSTWTHAFLRVCGDEASGGYRRMNARVANQIPIPPVNPTWPILVDMCRGAHHEPTFDQEALDQTVADCFGLTKPTRRALRRASARDG